MATKPKFTPLLEGKAAAEFNKRAEIAYLKARRSPSKVDNTLLNAILSKAILKDK